MRKIGILQPHYIPYLGYFSLIKKVDTFVILDNVKYIKEEWKNRNKIRFNSKLDKTRWLTIPINKNQKNLNINKIEIYNYKEIINNHLKLISKSYLKSNYYNDIVKIYSNVSSKLNNKLIKLSHLNALFIIEICSYLEIDTNILFASHIDDHKTEKNINLINIIKLCKGHIFIANNKSFQYLDLEIFKKNKIELIKQNYKFPVYVQKYNEKNLKNIANLSIIDTIANVGPKTLELL